MLTKEEYEKTFIRMMDSVRTECKGDFSCYGVRCVTTCPISNVCHAGSILNRPRAFDLIEAVEQWGKAHPFVTNAYKFKEVFGVEPRHPDGMYICPIFYVDKCPQSITVTCTECRAGFWEAEYREPKKEGE